MRRLLLYIMPVLTSNFEALDESHSPSVLLAHQMKKAVTFSDFSDPDPISQAILSQAKGDYFTHQKDQIISILGALHSWRWDWGRIHLWDSLGRVGMGWDVAIREGMQKSSPVLSIWGPTDLVQHSISWWELKCMSTIHIIKTLLLGFLTRQSQATVGLCDQCHQNTCAQVCGLDGSEWT